MGIRTDNNNNLEPEAEQENLYNLEPEEDLDPDMQDKVGGTYDLVNSIFKIVGFFADILIRTITEYINVFSKNDK